MKKLSKFVLFRILWIIVLAFVYLSMAFIKLDLDVSWWSSNERSALLFISLLLYVFAVWAITLINEH